LGQHSYHLLSVQVYSCGWVGGWVCVCVGGGGGGDFLKIKSQIGS
jgi:hypothetical protein